MKSNVEVRKTIVTQVKPLFKNNTIISCRVYTTNGEVKVENNKDLLRDVTFSFSDKSYSANKDKYIDDYFGKVLIPIKNIREDGSVKPNNYYETNVFEGVWK